MSTIECWPAGIPGHAGEAAAISHWWLRNEPPNAPWKKSAVAVQVLVDGQGGRVVVPLGQACGVAPGRVPVLGAVIELVLLLVEAVHDVAGASARQVGRARRQSVGREDARLRAGLRAGRDVGPDVERLVGEVTGDGAVDAVRGLRRRFEVDVVLQQAGVGHAVLPDLGHLPGGRVGAAVDPLPTAVEVVEAVVLLVDHDDVVDAGELLVRAGLHGTDGRPCGHNRGETEGECQRASQGSRHRRQPPLQNPVSQRLRASRSLFRPRQKASEGQVMHRGVS